MAVRLTVMCVALLMVTLVAMPGVALARRHHGHHNAAKPGPSEPGNFDYYVLSLSWSPESRSAGRGKVGVNGSGVNLRLPTLPLTTPVKVQLQQDGSSACWEATYSTATTNTGSAFKAKSD